MASAPVALPKNSMEICINIFIDIFQMNGFLTYVSLSISNYCIMISWHSLNIIDSLYLKFSIQLIIPYFRLPFQWSQNEEGVM